MSPSAAPKDAAASTPTRAIGALAGIYFTSFAATYLWTILPRHFEALGWSGAAIGALYGARKVTGGGLMWAWGAAADERGGRGLVRAQFAMGFLAMCALPWVRDYEVALVMIVAFGGTAGCALPLVDTLTMQAVGAQRYGRLRAWGAAGFGALALVAAGLGLWRGDYDELARLAPWLMVGALGLTALSTWGLPAGRAPEARARPRPAQVLRAVRAPALLGLLGVGMLHWACQAPYNIFLVQLCELRQMPAWTPGLAVCVGVALEFVVLNRSEQLLERAQPSTWLLVAVAASSARWWASGQVESAPALVALQALHGLSFGAFLAAAIAMLAQHVPEELRASGQALFYVTVFVAGSTLGSMLAGVGFDASGPARLFVWTGWVEAALVAPAGWLAWRAQAAAQR